MQRRNHTPCHNHILFLPSNPYLKHISKDKREKKSPRPPLSQSQTPSLIILHHLILILPLPSPLLTLPPMTLSHNLPHSLLQPYLPLHLLHLPPHLLPRRPQISCILRLQQLDRLVAQTAGRRGVARCSAMFALRARVRGHHAEGEFIRVAVAGFFF